jgi:hypothetical protein
VDVGGIHRGQHRHHLVDTPAGSAVPRGKLENLARERDRGIAARGALGGAFPVDGEEQKVLLLGHREGYFTIIGHPSNLARRDRSVSPWSDENPHGTEDE